MKLIFCYLLLVTGALAVPARQRLRWIRDGAGSLHLFDSSAPSNPSPGFDGPSDVTLELYTQGNPKVAEYITMDDDSKSPSFNPQNPTRVVIHGWVSNARNLEPYRDAFIETGNEYNIILVDWEGPAAGDVPSTLANAVLVGDYVGKVLTHLMENRGLDPDSVVIIGHSAGGKVAGVTGNRFGGGLAAEIIGLDPATGSEDLPMEDQLDASDAKFVQIMYTEHGRVGSQKWIGDVFFYPNGGKFQVGCSEYEETVEGCSHNRAPLYFIESINSRNFVATACPSYDAYAQGLCKTNEHVVMGAWTPMSISGSYFLKTNPKAPFAQGKTDL